MQTMHGNINVHFALTAKPLSLKLSIAYQNKSHHQTQNHGDMRIAKYESDNVGHKM